MFRFSASAVAGVGIAAIYSGVTYLQTGLHVVTGAVWTVIGVALLALGYILHRQRRSVPIPWVVLVALPLVMAVAILATLSPPDSVTLRNSLLPAFFVLLSITWAVVLWRKRNASAK